MEDNRLKGSPFGAPPQKINFREDLLKLFRGLIGNKTVDPRALDDTIASQVKPDASQVKPESVDLGTVKTQLSDEQKKLIGQEEKTPDTEAIRVNLVEDPNKKERDSIIQYKSGLMYNPKTKRYDTPDPIASAIMFAESSGIHKKGKQITKSEDDAQGLMQLVPKAFAHPTKPAGYGVNYTMTKKDIKDPEKNYKAGRDYIYGLINFWQKQGYPNEDAFDLAVMSYNAGVPKVTRYLKQVTREGKKSKIVMEDDTYKYLNNVYKALGSKPIQTKNNKKIYKKIKKPEEYKNILEGTLGSKIIDKIDKREEFLKQQKQSGGMIESDPYKREPRFI